jgi:hypothetical protein
LTYLSLVSGISTYKNVWEELMKKAYENNF